MCEIEEIDLSQGEIDGYDDSQGPWDYDPFGPDADVWRELDDMENDYMKEKGI